MRSGLSLTTKTPLRETGFVLPLTLSASAILLLGSASICLLSLQGRLRLMAAIQRDRAADQLRSAAQAFTSMASGPQACLLLLPSVDWNSRQANCSGAEPALLLQGMVGEQSWHLRSWQPGQEMANLRLALADGRRASFRLRIAADGSQIESISDLQLQGRVASEAL